MDSIEPVICECSLCLSRVGQFDNLWDKIGKTYYSPIYVNPRDLPGIQVVGDVREAPKGVILEGSFLQDLICTTCGAILGLRCDRAPEGHVLHRDQLILRLGGMSVMDKNNNKATLAVRNTHVLVDPSVPAQSAGSARQEPSEESNNGSDADDQSQDFTRWIDWAEAAIDGQRQDIDCISKAVENIERGMRSFEDLMDELRGQFALTPKTSRVDQIDRDVAGLHHGVANMRKEMRRQPDGASIGKDQGGDFFVEEVEALTESISRISQKANEVDVLKLEIQFMKGRLKRIEDATRGAAHSTSRSYGKGSGESEGRPSHVGGSHSKRKIKDVDASFDGALDQSITPSPPSKRLKASDEIGHRIQTTGLQAEVTESTGDGVNEILQDEVPRNDGHTMRNETDEKD